MTDILNQSSDSENLSLSSDLGENGLDALKKEREQRRKLEQQLKELKGKAEVGDILAGEVQEYKAKLQTKEQEYNQSIEQLKGEISQREKIITQSKIESEFLKTAGEIQLNSKFQGLLLNAHKDQFTVADGVVKTADGKTVKEWLEDQRSQYPELFDAPKTSGSGMGGSRSNSSGTRRTVINSSDNRQFLDNLDGIIDGSVSVER
jgi:uncharacterized membrane protein YkoI